MRAIDSEVIDRTETYLTVQNIGDAQARDIYSKPYLVSQWSITMSSSTNKSDAGNSVILKQTQNGYYINVQSLNAYKSLKG